MGIGKKLESIFVDFQKKLTSLTTFFCLFLPYLKKLCPDLAQILHECFKQSYASEKYTPTPFFIDTLDFSFFNLIFFDFFFFVLAITQKVTGRFGPDFACVLPTIIRRGNNLSELSYERYFGL